MNTLKFECFGDFCIGNIDKQQPRLQKDYNATFAELTQYRCLIKILNDFTFNRNTMV